MLLEKSYIRSLKKTALGYAEDRRVIIKMSDDALHLSKRAIFAMHRDDMAEALHKLDGASKLLLSLQKKFVKDNRAMSEGAYRASIEEFVEASLLYQFLTTGRIGKVECIELEMDSYVGGLCDVPGELLRYAIKAATMKDRGTAVKCAEMAREIVGELIEFNLTKHLRHKFDQARTAIAHIERVIYDLSLRE